MAAACRDDERTMPTRLSYEIAATNWTRVATSFVRSLQAYRNAARRRELRPVRPARTATTNGHTLGVEHSATLTANGVISSSDALMPPATSPYPLTHRQLEVARLIARGLSNEEIARELVLTPGTVGNHIGHILRRLGARNRAQIASWVTRVVDAQESGNSGPRN